MLTDVLTLLEKKANDHNKRSAEILMLQNSLVSDDVVADDDDVVIDHDDGFDGNGDGEHDDDVNVGNAYGFVDDADYDDDDRRTRR